MALSDDQLNAKLRQYLEKFAKDWTFERLSHLGNEVHNEYEHDDDPKHPDFVQVHLQVLERITEGADDYYQVSVDISDNRGGVGKGSAYRALCGGMFVHVNGKTELDAPKCAANEV